MWGKPAWVLGCHIGPQGFTSPVVGELDGRTVVVDASLSGFVYVVNARTGKEMPGWPQAADLVGKRPTGIDSSPAIAYLDGPGKEPSIVVGVGSQYEKDQNGGVMAWYADGHVRFRFKSKKTFLQWGHGAARYSNSVFATPAIGDITGSGQQDVVFGSFDHYLYALNGKGKPITGFPVSRGNAKSGFPINRADTIWSSPALADTTHSGRFDIIEGGDSSGWRGPDGGKPCWGGWVYDYRYSNDKPDLIWERCLAETVWSSPAVTTFGSTPVVVVGTSWAVSARKTQPAEDEVFAFDALNGHTMPGWPRKTGGPTFGSPAVGPARPGGPNDVFESSCASCLKGPALVTAWSESGKQLWRTRVSRRYQLTASPAVADVTGSRTSNDVLIGDTNGLFVLNATNGKKVAGTEGQAIDPYCVIGGTPVVAPVPHSKTGYMLFTNCGFAGPEKATDEYVRAYNIPAPASPAPWPMFRANAQRTGVADPDSVTPGHCSVPTAPLGYRVVTEAGVVSAFGHLGMCGDLARQLLPQNVAGMASTDDGGGYWIALRDGAVYSFGNARSYGDLRGSRWRGGPASPGAPIVGIAPSRDGKGYYLLGGDGAVYAFGDAAYHGSVRESAYTGVVVGITSDTATGGYWVATSSGRVLAFDAPKLGGAAGPGTTVGIAAAAGGRGYWLVSSRGHVVGVGAAAKLAKSVSGTTIVSIAAATTGYYLLSSHGKVYALAGAPGSGSVSRPRSPVVAVSST